MACHPCGAVHPDPYGEFDIDESVLADGVRLSLIGELDVAVVDRLRHRLASVARPGARVVIDLSELSFIDSAGLNVIITGLREAEREGWELRIEPTMSSAVRRVVATMGLDAVFWG